MNRIKVCFEAVSSNRIVPLANSCSKKTGVYQVEDNKQPDQNIYRTNIYSVALAKEQTMAAVLLTLLRISTEPDTMVNYLQNKACCVEDNMKMVEWKRTILNIPATTNEIPAMVKTSLLFRMIRAAILRFRLINLALSIA